METCVSMETQVLSWFMVQCNTFFDSALEERYHSSGSGVLEEVEEETKEKKGRRRERKMGRRKWKSGRRKGTRRRRRSRSRRERRGMKKSNRQLSRN